jgi:hypothetical protein
MGIPASAMYSPEAGILPFQDTKPAVMPTVSELVQVKQSIEDCANFVPFPEAQDSSTGRGIGVAANVGANVGVFMVAAPVETTLQVASLANALTKDPADAIPAPPPDAEDNNMVVKKPDAPRTHRVLSEIQPGVNTQPADADQKSTVLANSIKVQHVNHPSN